MGRGVRDIVTNRFLVSMLMHTSTFTQCVCVCAYEMKCHFCVLSIEVESARSEDPLDPLSYCQRTLYRIDREAEADNSQYQSLSLHTTDEPAERSSEKGRINVGLDMGKMPSQAHSFSARGREQDSLPKETYRWLTTHIGT